MMEKENEELLRQYIDGELSSEEERNALHIIADDPYLRSMLRFEQKLQDTASSFRELPDSEVPLHFSDSVMSRIEKQTSTETVPGLWTRISELVQSIVQPREIHLRPVYAVAFVLAVVVLLGLPFYTADQNPSMSSSSTLSESTSIQSVSDDGEQVWTRFVYIDKEAESISVAGDFSNWEPIELTRQKLNGDHVWTALVPMNRGEHRYMFVKNGEQWVTDPLATVQQDDGFGNKNAVIYL